MRRGILLFTILFVVGCDSPPSSKNDATKSQTQNSNANETVENQTHQPTSGITFPRGTMMVGNKTIKVEIADTVERRSRGLMFRTSLPADEGMIFIFEQESPLEFWMRNTKIPLSIAYIKADLTIANILEMVPASDIDRDPKKYPSEGWCKYALEMNKEWFAKNKFGPGTKIKLPDGYSR